MNKMIHLISGPRNISTAMMYSFGNRKDITPIDEPFYAYYLKRNEVQYHPGYSEILASQSHQALEVLKHLKSELERSNIFIKNMAHHLNGFDLDWMFEAKNVFLIRDVRRLINSFSKVIEDVSIEDIGIQREWQLYNYLIENGQEAIVVDANEVLNNPKTTLKSVCDFCNIDFDSSMLSWPAGAKIYDGIWAKYWYNNVHNSISFGPPYKNVSVQVNEKYNDLLKQADFYYQKLLSKTITNATNL